MKVVINQCFGGFRLSEAAYECLGLEWDGYGFAVDHREISRCDPWLVQCVEELGPAASGDYAQLTVVEIPDDVEYTIENDRGNEWIAEAHRIWP